MRDRLPEFEGVAVIGVSPDSVRKHRRFADKHELDFTLLSDEEKMLCMAAGVWVEKTLYGRKYMGVERTSFLLDGTGRVERVWRKVKPENHAEEVLEELGG